MISELIRKVSVQRSAPNIDASLSSSVLNQYHQFDEKTAYNTDNNYYDNVQDDYELAADRVTIMKVTQFYLPLIFKSKQLSIKI
jgi:hypothetical protein